MNDDDYIQKAADLAVLWGFDKSTNPGWLVSPYGDFQTHLLDEPNITVLLDALAVQLVRQVDALDDRFAYISDIGWVKVLEYDGDAEPLPCWKNLSFVKGEDRTMNTIRAIVDSKVLESQPPKE